MTALELPFIGAMALALVVSLALGLVIDRWLIGFCHRRGILDYPGKRKRHKHPTPNIGGVSVFISVSAALSLALIFSDSQSGPHAPHWPSILAGGALIFIVGLRDDVKPVSAWIKLAAQALAGGFLYWGGMVVEVLYLPLVGEIHPGAWGILINVFWVALLSNAINLIDGLDGLAAGVSLIGAVALGVIALIFGVTEAALACAALSGALIAMLYFNTYPARLYLGDSGSLLIGYLFAVFSFLVPMKSFTTAALFPPLVALAVPLTETSVSFFRRLLAGKNILKADRRHLFHYLAYLGLGPRSTVRVFWLMSALCGAGAIAMPFSDKGLAVIALIVLAVAVFVVIVILGLRLRRGVNQNGRHKPASRSG